MNRQPLVTDSVTSAILVDYDRTPSMAILDGRYDYYDPELVDKHFPLPAPARPPC